MPQDYSDGPIGKDSLGSPQKKSPVTERNDIRNILGIMIIAFSFIVLSLLVFVKIPENNKDVLNTCIGMVLGASITGVMGYFYNDSKKEKNTDNN